MNTIRSLTTTLALATLLGVPVARAATPQEAESSSALQRTLAALRQEEALPCDTWVALPDATKTGTTILAKNSDRTVFDCQPLLLHPRRMWPAGAEIDLGRTRVPQVAETFATLGSSPYWCWGYEEGINQFGVAIGNEGLFTRARSEDVAASFRGDGPPLGPTGMDLLRLTLERARTAREAVQTLGALLEEHGQFGSGLPLQNAAAGAYDNSYIVADPREAWVMETCGRAWVSRRFTEGTTSISNVPCIGKQWDLASEALVADAVERGWWRADEADAFDFAAASLDPSPLFAAQAERARTRSACSSGLLAERHGTVDPRWMMHIARDRSTNPSLDLDVTASSCVAVLPDGEGAIPVFWWSASVPSNGCYVPFFVQGSELSAILSKAGTAGRMITAPSRVAQNGFSSTSYWWLFRELGDLVRMDYADRNRIVRQAFDPLELDFERGLAAVIDEATSLRRQGNDAEVAARLDAYSAACVERVLTTLGELRDQLGAMELQVPEALRPFTGRYTTEVNGQPVAIEVLVQDGKLAVKLPDGRIFELLEPDGSGRWVFALTDQAAVTFEGGQAGPSTSMRLQQPGAAFELRREEDDSGTTAAQDTGGAFPAAAPESQGMSGAKLAELVAEVEAFLERDMFVGGELLVIKNRRTVLHESFGHLDREDDTPWSNGTVCNIRSMTKPLTGAAAQILVDRGQLDLDAPAARYLPGFDTDAAREITVRQIMTHRAGLPLTNLRTMEDHANLIDMGNAVGASGPEFEPGSRFWYSDSGTDALGAIVEVVSGKRIDEFVREELLVSLGMADSFYFYDDEDPRRSRIASLYAGGIGNWSRFLDPDEGAFYPYAWGSQSLYSTPVDYAKFLALWMDGGRAGERVILSEDAVARTLTPVSEMSMLGSEARFPSGYTGLEVMYGQMAVLHVPVDSGDGTEGRDKATIIGHSGSDGTIAWAWPERDLIVLFFTQSRGGGGVLRLEEAIDRLLIAPAAYVDAPEAPPELHPYLGVYISDWANHMKEEFVVGYRNGRFTLDVPSQMIYELAPVEGEEKWTFAIAPTISVWFERHGPEEDVCLRIAQGQLTFEAPRKGTPHEEEFTAANRPDPEEVDRFLGIYHDPEEDEDIEVFVDGDYVAVRSSLGVFHLWKIPLAETWQVRENPMLSLTFQEEGGVVISLTRHSQGGAQLVMPRVE